MLTNQQLFTTGAKYGAIAAGSGFLWTCFEFAIGLHDKYVDLHPYLTNLFFLIAIAITIFSLNEIKRLNGSLNVMLALKLGLVVGLVNLPLSLLSFYVFIEYVNPDMLASFIENMMQDYYKGGKNFRTGKALEEAYKTVTNYFSKETYYTQIAIGGVIVPVTMSVIAGFFKRTKSK
jgi:hypothetical protein